MKKFMNKKKKEASHMNQVELCRELGVSKPYISMVLSGKKKPSKRVADRLKQVNFRLTLNSSNGLKIRWPSGCAGANTLPADQDILGCNRPVQQVH